MQTTAATQPTMQEPPFAPGLPILGNMLEFVGHSGLPIDFLTQTARNYGDLVRIMAANQRIYLVSHPDLVHQILVERVNDFHKPGSDSDKPTNLTRFLGKGILTADHEEWRPQRKLIQPLMHTRHIEGYADAMTHFGTQLIETWRDGDVRDIHTDMAQVTLWIISETMFGMAATHSANLENVGTTAQRVAVSDISMPLPTILAGFRDRQAAEINVALDEIVDGVIAQRDPNETADRGDLLSLLLNTRDEDGNPASREFVRDNILTLFFAGHETTANTLTWALYYLDQNPAIRAKLTQELDTVLGGRTPTLADLKQLPYTMQVIKETMRIEPIVSVIPRYIGKDTELDGKLLKGNSVMMLFIYALHHDPRWWTNPAEFDPDRFSAANEPTIPKYAYLPFGGGPRVCIGNHFALMEAQLLLAMIAGKYELHLQPGTDVTPLRQITSTPSHGMPMKLIKRG